MCAVCLIYIPHVVRGADLDILVAELDLSGQDTTKDALNA